MRVAGVLDEFPAVKGFPYSLAETKTTTKTSSDGTTTTEVSESRKMRDSDGRTRIEVGRTVDGSFEADHIMITDPDARFQANFDNNKRTGTVSYLPQPKVRTAEEEATRAEQKAEARKVSEARDAASPEVEHLGSRKIAGLDADGTRRPRTIQVLTEGGVSDIRLVTERWRSAELKIDLAGTTDDPRGIKTIFVVNDLQRIEPDASLFKVPDGYTVTTRGKP